LLEEEEWGKDTALPESSSEDEEHDITDTYGEDSGDSSSGDDAEESSEQEENSLKVDITG
jgi:hypothetical protein